MGQLDGMVAIVTGGARGIGAGIARVMADQGAKVGILDLDGETAAKTAAELAVPGMGRSFYTGVTLKF
jgi:NAD(P)-dependent dehydrogenase (short-subunit alcohol dehydrogenase family)